MHLRKLFSAVFTLGILLFFAADSSASVQDTLVIRTKTYCDHCAACETCKARIEHELSFTKGVRQARLQVDQQVISVVYNPKKVTPDVLRKAVNKAGYDADDMAASPEQVSKLDGCCQKRN